MNEGLILMTVGMVVVFSALMLLLGAIALLFRAVAEKKPAAEVRNEKPTEKSAPPVEEKIDSQLVAILTAAASAALGARVRVHRVGFIDEQWLADHGWVQQARAEHHASHRGRSH